MWGSAYQMMERRHLWLHKVFFFFYIVVCLPLIQISCSSVWFKAFTWIFSRIKHERKIPIFKIHANFSFKSERYLQSIVGHEDNIKFIVINYGTFLGSHIVFCTEKTYYTLVDASQNAIWPSDRHCHDLFLCRRQQYSEEFISFYEESAICMYARRPLMHPSLFSGGVGGTMKYEGFEHTQ